MTAFQDYVRMYKARGLGRVVRHLVDVELYDLINRTDTKNRISMDAYPEDLKDRSGAEIYQPSFTSEIKQSICYLSNYIDNYRDYIFIDLGCGKGKACFIAESYDFANSIGIELNGDIVSLAEKNRKILKSSVKFIEDSVLSYSYPDSRIVFYAFNPFTDEIMAPLLERIASCKECFFIYGNPVHERLFDTGDWRLLMKKDSATSSSLKTNIYQKT